MTYDEAREEWAKLRTTRNDPNRDGLEWARRFAAIGEDNWQRLLRDPTAFPKDQTA